MIHSFIDSPSLAAVHTPLHMPTYILVPPRIILHTHTQACATLRTPRRHIMRGDSRHTHNARAHAVLAHIHVYTCTHLHAHLHAHGIYIHQARRLETHSHVCICTCRASTLACAHIHTYKHMVCIHTLCAETRDTLTYVHMHMQC